MSVFLLVGLVAVASANPVTIETSCGVEVEMIYEDHHTGADVVNDAKILEEYFCE